MHMKKLSLLAVILLCLCACATSNVNHRPHQTGDKAGDFTLPDQNGEMVRLGSVLSTHRGAVLAFYPKDDSRN